MDRELRHTVATVRGFLRQMDGFVESPPRITPAEASQAVHDARASGLPFIQPPHAPPNMAVQLHALCEKFFRDSCDSLVATCGGSIDIPTLQRLTTNLRDTYVSLYADGAAQLSEAFKLRAQKQKQIADVSGNRSSVHSIPHLL